MTSVSTHVLDTSTGEPVVGVASPWSDRSMGDGSICPRVRPMSMAGS